MGALFVIAILVVAAITPALTRYLHDHKSDWKSVFRVAEVRTQKRTNIDVFSKVTWQTFADFRETHIFVCAPARVSK